MHAMPLQGRRAAIILGCSIVAMLFAAGTRGADSTGGNQPDQQPALHGDQLIAVCSACHGAHGNSTDDPTVPKLAGQDRDYLITQLEDFKSGARKSDIMAPVVADLSQAQLAEAARYFSGQAVVPDARQDRQLAALGARVFNAPSRNAPPCAACHGGGYGPMRGGMMGGGGMMGRGMMGGGMGPMGMMGSNADVPNLFGQHAAYASGQLEAFASGQRRGTVMNAIAAGLSQRERTAVAQYLAGLK